MHETVESIEARLKDINVERIQNKEEEIHSQKQDDKNITIDEEEVAASPYGTHPDDMGEGVSETKDDKNEIIYEEKEAACPDDTPPDDMEVGVADAKDDKDERLDDERRGSMPR